MFVLGNLLAALANVMDFLLTVYTFIIIARALVSWVNPDPYNPIVQFLHRATDPILEPIRRLFPPMGIDISPMIAYVAIHFLLQPFLVRTLFDLSMRLR